MIAEPRRIGRLDVRVNVPVALEEKQRKLLEQAALHCPVHASLHPDIQAPITFQYPK